ncbi:16S rRNA (cytidine(1402)-2'-O)-methyltransferase [Treponema endosymbiont of Eucomonympha sp.]|uniref:16S rRNA (cytidine(1402)-2'-O)-methyltransferase n=1 Tax=Treponema endosymbiont of Eucomonympha sp. TaxID=1580831 RepID=UPI001396AC3B|nr:16S rRNA (cytidine(1402)-2'-O)-methyltransferase [Treponema endosymbiont of Eucomonympha sp.]
MPTLYIVGTPIGNLGDITLRALETFKAVDLIACEDTRRTLQLLAHFGIQKQLVSCRAQNEAQRAQKIVRLLGKGKNVAYASDAGTPGLSDPGGVLVHAVRRAGFPVVPIPGVSAFAALVSVASSGKTVLFEGFLSPRNGRRKTRLAELMTGDYGIVLYESPFRITKLLADIVGVDCERRVVVGRELTKLHEEIVEGTAKMVWDDFSGRAQILGEFSVYIAGGGKAQKTEDAAGALQANERGGGGGCGTERRRHNKMRQLPANAR